MRSFRPTAGAGVQWGIKVCAWRLHRGKDDVDAEDGVAGPVYINMARQILYIWICIYRVLLGVYPAAATVGAMLPSRRASRPGPLWKTLTLRIGVYVFPAYNICTDYIMRLYFFSAQLQFRPHPSIASWPPRYRAGRDDSGARLWGNLREAPTQGLAVVRHRRPLRGTDSGYSREKNTLQKW